MIAQLRLTPYIHIFGLRGGARIRLASSYCNKTDARAHAVAELSQSGPGSPHKPSQFVKMWSNVWYTPLPGKKLLTFGKYGRIVVRCLDPLGRGGQRSNIHGTWCFLVKIVVLGSRAGGAHRSALFSPGSFAKERAGGGLTNTRRTTDADMMICGQT